MILNRNRKVCSWQEKT